jgi:chaperonin GroES
VNIRPLHDRVLVKRIELQEQVRGGIIIPDTAKEKPQEAEVVAIGPGKLNDDGKRTPLEVQPGDRVLMGKYSGSEIKLEDTDYVICREDEILAVIGNGNR